MRAAFALLMAALWLGTAPARAGEPDGELNPTDMNLDYWAGKAADGHFEPHICFYGVFLDKTGRHAEARRIFQRCAEAGNQYAMPWMSYLEENGFDRPSDPEKAAEWDRKLSDLGSPIGQLNYGLDLLRGHGAPLDRSAGKALIDKAAAAGDKTARDLAAHDYDPESVTPDADKARYRRPQF
ncbi:MAG TPA: sel1 repeat family protein [Rhodoblastus sp.]|nr:sel1 repeat family protein [Rhodoblastus sp.]